MSEFKRLQHMRIRDWQRLADRGLCCSRCGGTQGVWAPKVLCPSCRVERTLRDGGGQ